MQVAEATAKGRRERGSLEKESEIEY